jgi:hypothetical protein
VRARALRASVFFSSLPHITGRIAASLLLIRPPKNIYNLSNLGRPRQGLFFSTGPQRNMRTPARQNYVPMRPYALIFSVCYFFYSFWIFSFCYFLLFLLSFSISSYSSLLISSYSSRRCYSSSSYASLLIF